MKSTDQRTSNLPAFGVLPFDLLVVVGFVLVADVLVSAVSVRPVLRIVIGLPVLFFLPGYVLLAVLYPESGSNRTLADTGTSTDWNETPSFGTRLALSFGLSVALVPILAILLVISPVAFDASSMLLVVTGFVIVGATLGAIRRMRVPRDRRLRVPLGHWSSNFVSFLAAPRSTLGVAINVLLVLVVLLAATSLAYAVLVPPEDGEYTDFMLLTRSGDGEFVASDYPTNFTRGSSEELVVGIANHRDAETDYVVVTELQRVRGSGDSMEVVERSELDRHGVTVGSSELLYLPHDVEPDLAGEDLRLMFYLYRDSPPDEPSTDSADEYLHLWIDVSLDSAQGTDGNSSAPANTASS